MSQSRASELRAYAKKVESAFLTLLEAAADKSPEYIASADINEARGSIQEIVSELFYHGIKSAEDADNYPDDGTDTKIKQLKEERH